MSSSRVKQALMGIGLLTVLGVAAMVGLFAYVWWDSRSVDEEFSADTGIDRDAVADEDVESVAGDETDTDVAAD